MLTCAHIMHLARDMKPRVITTRKEGIRNRQGEIDATSLSVDYFEHRSRECFLREEVSRNFLTRSEIALGVPDPPRAATFTRCANCKSETVAYNTAVAAATVFHFHSRSGSLVFLDVRCVSFPHKTFIYSNDREAFHGFSEDWH